VREAAFKARLVEANGHALQGDKAGQGAGGWAAAAGPVAEASEAGGGHPPRALPPSPLLEPEPASSPRGPGAGQARGPADRLRTSAPAGLSAIYAAAGGGEVSGSSSRARARAVASSLQQLPSQGLRGTGGAPAPAPAGAGASSYSYSRSHSSAAGSLVAAQRSLDALDTCALDDQDFVARVTPKAGGPGAAASGAPLRSSLSSESGAPEHFELLFRDVRCAVPDAAGGAPGAGAAPGCCLGISTQHGDSGHGGGLLGAPGGVRLQTHDAQGLKIILHGVSGSARAGDVVGGQAPWALPARAGAAAQGSAMHL
jgi:hypothetical protein